MPPLSALRQVYIKPLQKSVTSSCNDIQRQVGPPLWGPNEVFPHPLSQALLPYIREEFL